MHTMWSTVIQLALRVDDYEILLVLVEIVVSVFYMLLVVFQ